MRGVILQPSYLPWRGYFDLIHRADVFVFYDDVQYDKHGWRNRNRVKTDAGARWLTVPVRSKGNVDNGLLLQDVRIDWHSAWNAKHAATLRQNYGRAPYFAQYRGLLDTFYGQRPELLADFTIETTVALCRTLGIAHTQFVRSSTLGITGEKTERLIRILQRVGATSYLSGPSARDYLDKAQFDAAGISLEYIRYEYPEYVQLHPPYDPQVSILDLLFMEGDRAPDFIWGGRP